MSGLVLSRHEDEVILIRVGGIEIRLLVTEIRNLNGRARVSLCIQAPQSVRIMREEIVDGACDSAESS